MNVRMVITCSIFLTISPLQGNTSSYEKTAYEKKVRELTLEYLEICFYGRTNSFTMYEVSQLDRFTSGEDARAFILAIGILNYAMYHNEVEVRRLVSRIESSFKAAETLKTSIDYQRETEIKKRNEQAAAEKKEKELQKEFLASDKGRIYNNVKQVFNNWVEKGEFEKEFEHENRLRTASQKVFNETCINVIIDIISGKLYSYEFTKILAPYNSEKEYFDVFFNFEYDEWKSRVYIPIEEAQNFKKNWDLFEIHDNDYQWCFLGSALVPLSITLVLDPDNLEPTAKRSTDRNELQSHYTLPILNLANINPIKISFNDLNIDNKFLKDYVFDIQTWKVFDLERKTSTAKADSIELAGYNMRLDSIFRACNEELLKNPYNVAKETMKDYPVVIENEDRNIHYSRKVNEIIQNFQKITLGLKDNLKSNNFSEYSRIYYSLNPQQKIEADLTYRECSCKYVNRILFDKIFLDGFKINCDCRQNAYQKYGYLFESKTEFNILFEKPDNLFQKEVSSRILKKEEEFALKWVELNNGLVSKSNFQDIAIRSHNENEVIQFYKKFISYRSQPFYESMVKIFIEINKTCAKEWNKNDSLFLDKIDFFNSYTSGEYKSTLSTRKKQP